VKLQLQPGSPKAAYAPFVMTPGNSMSFDEFACSLGSSQFSTWLTSGDNGRRSSGLKRRPRARLYPEDLEQWRDAVARHEGVAAELRQLRIAAVLHYQLAHPARGAGGLASSAVREPCHCSDEGIEALQRVAVRLRL